MPVRAVRPLSAPTANDGRLVIGADSISAGQSLAQLHPSALMNSCSAVLHWLGQPKFKNGQGQAESLLPERSAVGAVPAPEGESGGVQFGECWAHLAVIRCLRALEQVARQPVDIDFMRAGGARAAGATGICLIDRLTNLLIICPNFCFCFGYFSSFSSEFFRL